MKGRVARTANQPGSGPLICINTGCTWRDDFGTSAWPRAEEIRALLLVTETR